MLKFIILPLLFLASAVYATDSSIRVYNKAQDEVVVSKNTTTIRPIASITKLMTAMITLDTFHDLDEKILLTNKLKSSLPQGYYTRRELLTAMLVHSDNAAAETLADDYIYGRKYFIEAMNDKAKHFHMYNTNFDDPSGLSRYNTSTAEDVSKMLLGAFGYKFIRDTTVQTQVSITPVYKKKPIKLSNTNSPILFQFDNIDVSKTGFTNPAGFCLAMIAHKGSELYSIVVLGSDNKQSRINTVKTIMIKYLKD
jgi:D-alanyl-D-alanine endopeptidase (penicillin-binding protein 7)